MKKPLIGLTASHNVKTGESLLSPYYAEAVRQSGGIPVTLPLFLDKEEMEQMADTLDGFLFTGGPDIHPFYFNEETLEGCGDLSPLRDRLELDLVPVLRRKSKPVLAICRGAQILNIAMGGDIYQDIPSQLPDRTPRIAHRQPFHASNPSHHVLLDPSSRLFHSMGLATLEVNSAHHQAVRDIAPGLKVCARADDGVIEAIEDPSLPFFIGVQWHPELLFATHDHAKRLFATFLRFCKMGQ